MANSTVFLSKLTREVSDDVKEKLLKIVEDEIFSFAKVKSGASISSNVVGQPKVIVAIYDLGNIDCLKLPVMGSAIKLKIINLFLQNSIILNFFDIDVTLSTSTIKL